MTYEELRECEPIDGSMACDPSAFLRNATAPAASADLRKAIGPEHKPDADSATGSPATPVGLAGHFTRPRAAVAAFIATERRIRPDMRVLRSMSDAMLEDIGLTREDIEGTVRHGRNR
ncbi:MAG: DUF1127 domain-containing protein [Alphaproteobacteria bacterium]